MPKALIIALLIATIQPVMAYDYHEYANLYAQVQSRLTLADRLAEEVTQWWDKTGYYDDEVQPLLTALEAYKRGRE